MRQYPIREGEIMTHANQFDVETKLPESACCECGHRMDACSGPTLPSEGDLTLCIACACLNVFDADLKLRRPTDDEIFEAAKDSDLQTLRRAILSIPASTSTKDSEVEA